MTIEISVSGFTDEYTSRLLDAFNSIDFYASLGNPLSQYPAGIDGVSIIGSSFGNSTTKGSNPVGFTTVNGKTVDAIKLDINEKIGNTIGNAIHEMLHESTKVNDKAGAIYSSLDLTSLAGSQKQIVGRIVEELVIRETLLDIDTANSSFYYPSNTANIKWTVVNYNKPLTKSAVALTKAEVENLLGQLKAVGVGNFSLFKGEVSNGPTLSSAADERMVAPSFGQQFSFAVRDLV